MNKLVDITIERLADGLYGVHVRYPDGRKTLYISDNLETIPAALVRELATVRVTVHS